MKNEWNWMRERKTLTELCGCNKPYQLQTTNYVLCLECGSQYPDPDRTHLFGGMTVHGEAVCSQECWCKHLNHEISSMNAILSELAKKLSKDKANLSGLGEEE